MSETDHQSQPLDVKIVIKKDCPIDIGLNGFENIYF